MNDTIETTLLLNLFYFENGAYSRNDHFIEAKRRKAIALLDEDADELKEIDPELAEEYQETISYLETLSDEEYQTKKEELLQQVEVN
ncbi:conserved protein of unknown function [Streptococcus thermophilus]|uniref:transcriptional regulator n=1 Tax=Streptococcus thermophilus TaxID=1308 RepID=UPI0015C2742E|nr:transcriptional regulator [Streptococcus thermophilus]CAD0149475.1 conserved protein of unknown function [Streptococcus thermophilus]